MPIVTDSILSGLRTGFNAAYKRGAGRAPGHWQKVATRIPSTSASKTHTQPANPRRTPLCHPDHHFKRKERRQAVGLIRSPFKRMGVGLGAAYGTRCHSSLPKTGSPATEATGSPYDPLRGMRVTRRLLRGQGRFADSASKTHIPPANPRRTPLCHPDHYLKRKERRQAVGLIRSPLKRMGVGLGAAS